MISRRFAGSAGGIRTFKENRLSLTPVLEWRRAIIESGGKISDTQLADEIGSPFHVSADNGKGSCMTELLKNEDAEKFVVVCERYPTRGHKEYWELRKLKPLHLVEIESSSSTTRNTTTTLRFRTLTTSRRRRPLTCSRNTVSPRMCSVCARGGGGGRL